ncbi:sensor histidine kinase [Lactobacillus delbrueckii subsp. lactis DSM 20072]|uniref:sensor histidine kinase n=1 Tax=Lactobacillus delbrueckii TaxID=1584 RepID=UPI000202E7CA|nr:HAMP domain-containing sensor histidine kinase [Lactobacillus delbrueckii]ASW12544.1 sensor histidine kinase [Lactobacillus delbrueckii subsp. lactis DSM 20072]EGD27081.1 sensor histidine kinase [Lactobacillus delbrueckii subsp. lactis DSM 20072]KRK67299.1 sensor histidine kinase [Lactobacillus delbrueckii subsp. lactis DSM 20072]MCT3500353.1 sensor histidine kinase [Lactobacillus delbrueckii subsp. lactis]OOV10855.1 two-component sensor histidine kinase [Lactobacillus delbrueckii subsp. la
MKPKQDKEKQVVQGKRPRVKLTAAEKSELFAEGVVTVIIMLLLNMSVIILYHLAVLQDKSLVNGIYFLKKTMTIGPGYHIWSWERIGIILMGIADVIVLYWRLIRRYHQMQLRHIISELHYIANGHFDHRISFSVNNDMQKVIDSINSLVDSTVRAINEEKAIEQSKDELITNVSHDIRTPLTSIIGYLGLLKNGAVTSQEDMLKYINIAYDKAEQMRSLANDLFEYTTLKSTKTKLNVTPINIKGMMEQVAAGFELEAEKKGIAFSVKARPDDLIVNADVEKLVRVYNNLISNALKYAAGASRINLVANLINHEQVELRVENNGEPIPKDKLKKIFDRFYRVESSRNTKTGGTGLGLSIVQGAVELHGGTIRCESNKDWTSFIILLPLDPQANNFALRPVV